MNMTMKQRITRYGILAALIMGLVTAVLNTQATTQSAGVVLLANGEAKAQQNTDAARALSRRSDIYVGDRITTGNESQLQLRMKDGAMVALGANAEFVVQAYGEAAKGDKKDEAVLSLVKGGLRTISGQIAKSSYSMSTPTATLGIRGTVFDVFVRNGGSTVVILRNGQVVVNGLAGGTEVLTQPGLASVINTGSAPSKPTTPPADVLDYLRGILPSIPDNVTWESTDNGARADAGTDIINIINDLPPEIQGDGAVPGTPAGGESACVPGTTCYCQQNPYQC
ncbi:MAG: FecR domain-containing protein [Cellvibrionales bacterium]|nr:FecR domain-containing protein [Cellvibrionales bacterium]